MPLAMIIPFGYKIGSDTVDEVMNTEIVQNFMKKNEAFDVCLIEIFSVDALVVFKFT